jgi:hypothetical protein
MPSGREGVDYILMHLSGNLVTLLSVSVKEFEREMPSVCIPLDLVCVEEVTRLPLSNLFLSSSTSRPCPPFWLDEVNRLTLFACTVDQQLRNLMGQLGGGGAQQGGVASDLPTNDNSETIYISSLALLKVGFLDITGGAARGRSALGREHDH